MSNIESKYALIHPDKIASKKRGIVLEAHPDDISMFGLTKHLANKGIGITVVTLTDGSARGIKGYTPHELASQRWKESQKAVEIVGAAEVFNAGLPDGRLGEYREEAQDYLRQIVDRTGAEWIAAPNKEDTHPDHRDAFDTALVVANNDIAVVGMSTINGMDRSGFPLTPSLTIPLSRRTARHERRSYRAHETQTQYLPPDEQREAFRVMAMTQGQEVSIYEANNTKINPLREVLLGR